MRLLQGGWGLIYYIKFTHWLTVLSQDQSETLVALFITDSLTSHSPTENKQDFLEDVCLLKTLLNNIKAVRLFALPLGRHEIANHKMVLCSSFMEIFMFYLVFIFGWQ